MGKKKRNKIIREIAKELPLMQQNAIRKELFNGSDVLPPGVLVANIGGTEILAGRTYVNDQLIKVNVNHYKRLKKVVSQNGIKGATAYIVAVKAIQRKQDQKAK